MITREPWVRGSGGVSPLPTLGGVLGLMEGLPPSPSDTILMHTGQTIAPGWAFLGPTARFRLIATPSDTLKCIRECPRASWPAFLLYNLTTLPVVRWPQTLLAAAAAAVTIVPSSTHHRTRRYIFANGSGPTLFFHQSFLLQHQLGLWEWCRRNQCDWFDST